MQFSRISETAHYVPSKCVTNDDLSELMDTSDEWITSRTGIKKRHISTGEITSDLAAKVAEQLLNKRQVVAETVDFIIVATMTPDFATPSTACLVQSKVGLKNSFAFDVSAACSGFVYALSVGSALIESGKYRLGMVIGAETLSRVVDWEDRSTSVLFGDGAGGVLLEACSEKRFIAESLHSDGTRGMALTAGQLSQATPFFENELDYNSKLSMNGREIFDFAIREVRRNISDVVEKSPFDIAEVDYLLLHQANMRIIKSIAKKLKISEERFLMNMSSYGNTSGASIPILLDEAVENKTLSIGSGQKVVFTGFGGGLTWGSLLVEL